MKPIILILVLLTVGCTNISNQNPNPEAAHINLKLAKLYLEQGQIETAKRKMLLAKKQAPNDPVVQGALRDFFQR